MTTEQTELQRAAQALIEAIRRDGDPAFAHLLVEYDRAMAALAEQKPEAPTAVGDLLAAFNRIAQRFISGNRVPIGRASVPIEEWRQLSAALERVTFAPELEIKFYALGDGPGEYPATAAMLPRGDRAYGAACVAADRAARCKCGPTCQDVGPECRYVTASPAGAPAQEPAEPQWQTPPLWAVTLVKAAVNMVAAVDTQYATRDVPLKFTVPWGALNDLREALGAPGMPAVDLDQPPQRLPESPLQVLERMGWQFKRGTDGRIVASGPGTLRYTIWPGTDDESRKHIGAFLHALCSAILGTAGTESTTGDHS